LGVTVRSSHSVQERVDALNKGPLALAYIFVLSCAPVAAVLAIGATAFALVATGRRRRRDLRALTVVGISRRTVVRSILLETGLVLGVALVLGTAVGVVASRLALSSLPQFPDGTGGVPISHVLPLRPLAVVVLALAVVFALITVTAPYVILRGATFSGAVRGGR
jgi:ABC-type antimicrobial peptide transport system permease subunit